MTALYLHHPKLVSALGPDLASATSRFRAGQLPTAQSFTLHERAEPRPYLGVAEEPCALVARLASLLPVSAFDPEETLLIIASTTLDIGQIETRVCNGAALDNGLSTPLDNLARHFREQMGFAEAFTLNTACTSAANGLLYAARLIRGGRYRRALVMTFETQSAIAQQGFGVLELTSPSGHYRPFHPERDGLILGEAYASVLIDTCADGAFARLLGGFSACDTSSLTNTREDGAHIEWVMQRALASAQIGPDAIGLVKAHGTATESNDVAERNGMYRLFGEGLPPLHVLKPYLGHTLGACGLTETLLLLDALARGGLPGVDYAAESGLPLPEAPLHLPAAVPTLLNYFGFGGNNASLVVQGAEP